MSKIADVESPLRPITWQWKRLKENYGWRLHRQQKRILYRLAAPVRLYRNLRRWDVTKILTFLATVSAVSFFGLFTAADFAAHLSPVLTLLWLAAECLAIAPLCFKIAVWSTR